MQERHIYLDYAAATPVDPVVFQSYTEALARFANPSSIHSLGSAAKLRLRRNREKVADLFGTRERSVVFTSGATEANNIALQGSVRAAIERGVERPHIIVGAIEHDSIKEVAHKLARAGLAEVTLLEPSPEGFIDPQKLKEAIQENTELVALSHVHSELGSVAPIKEYARTMRSIKRRQQKRPSLLIDASQSLAVYSIRDVAQYADMVVAEGSKIYGVRGCGVLVKQTETSLEPIFYGGGQEGGLRPGTENTAAIEAFTQALLLANERAPSEEVRLRKLSDTFVQTIKETLPKVKINSPQNGNRAPHIVNACFPGFDAEFLVISLDARGVFVSRGSACKEHGPDISEAVRMTRGVECATSSVRFSFGRGTKEKDIGQTVSVLETLVNRS